MLNYLTMEAEVLVIDLNYICFINVMYDENFYLVHRNSLCNVCVTTNSSIAAVVLVADRVQDHLQTVLCTSRILIVSHSILFQQSTWYQIL